MKRTILLFAFILILSNLGFSQNILFLKNGDKMNGKLEGCKNDTITFNIQGNKLKLRTFDITSIYFDEKLIPNELNKPTMGNEIKPIQNGRVSGVITYFFNDNFGSKPDVGADVYIVESNKVPDFNYATVDSFYNSNIHRLYRSKWGAIVSSNKVLANIIVEAKKYNLDRKSFNSLDKRAATNISQIIDAKDVMNLNVDGIGNFSIKVKPGTYFICIKSKNIIGLNVIDTTGEIKCERLIVKEDGEYNVSCEFAFEYRK